MSRSAGVARSVRSGQDSCAGSSWGMALELRLDGSAPWLNSSAWANRSTRLRVSLGDNSPSSPHLRLARSSGHIGERDTAWKLWAPRCLLRQCSLKIHERNPELSNPSILIGWSRFRPRTILPSWRQAIGKGGFLAPCLPPPATFSHCKLLQTRKPRSDGSRASLIHPKESVSKLSRIRGGKPQEHGGPQGIHSTTADRSHELPPV